MKYIIGIDEAGRGPLAGPVSVGLVMISQKDRNILKGIKDSKKLSEKRREEWFEKLKKEKKVFYTCAMVGPKVIDERGISYAIRLAVKKVCLRTGKKNCEILLDGILHAPKIYKNQKTIIKGDEKIPVISAASIVAKVTRDRKMKVLSKKYPKYEFEKHKGYGTKDHYIKIKKYGRCKIHRKSFLDNYT
jgi:ribonuclease HII